MWTKVKLSFICSVLLLSCPHVFAMEEGAAPEAIDVSATLASSVPTDALQEVNENWGSLGLVKPLLMASGRPDVATPTWEGFVAKIDKDGQDYTLYVDAHPKARTALTAQQQEIINLIQQQDIKNIMRTLAAAKSSAAYREPAFLDAVLDLVWSPNFRVKATALYLLALLTKEQKLPDYVYRAWAQASREGNYTYLSTPFFEPGTCRTWIHQLGIYDIAGRPESNRMGLAHATALPGAISQPLMRRTMTEDFFVVSGEGEFYLNDGVNERVFRAKPGTYFVNPKGMHIQFKNISNVPMTLLVPTLPPFDDVVRAWPVDHDKEIHLVTAHWPFNEYNEVMRSLTAKVKELLSSAQGKQQAAIDILNAVAEPNNTSYLYRYLLITLSPKSDFVPQKLQIAKNVRENWGLRKAAIDSLKDVEEAQEELEAIKL